MLERKDGNIVSYAHVATNSETTLAVKIAKRMNADIVTQFDTLRVTNKDTIVDGHIWTATECEAVQNTVTQSKARKATGVTKEAQQAVSNSCREDLQKANVNFHKWLHGPEKIPPSTGLETHISISSSIDISANS